MTRVTSERVTRPREAVTYPRLPRPGESATKLVMISLQLENHLRGQAHVTLYDDGSSFVSARELTVGGRSVDVEAWLGRDGRPREGQVAAPVIVEDPTWGATPVSDYHRELVTRRLPAILAEARSRLTAAWLSHPYEPPPATAVTP